MENRHWIHRVRLFCAHVCVWYYYVIASVLSWWREKKNQNQRIYTRRVVFAQRLKWQHDLLSADKCTCTTGAVAVEEVVEGVARGCRECRAWQVCRPSFLDSLPSPRLRARRIDVGSFWENDIAVFPRAAITLAACTFYTRSTISRKEFVLYSAWCTHVYQCVRSPALHYGYVII